MGIGAELRQARLARKLSIDDVSRATKISPTLLAAIEREAFDSIPQGLFTRGYLRAYAREVGVDPDAIVGRFRELFDRRPVSSEGEAIAAAEAKADDTERIDPDELSL